MFTHLTVWWEQTLVPTSWSRFVCAKQRLELVVKVRTSEPALGISALKAASINTDATLGLKFGSNPWIG